MAFHLNCFWYFVFFEKFLSNGVLRNFKEGNGILRNLKEF